MKISVGLLGLVSSEWTKPSYYDFIYKEPGQNNNLFPVKTEKFNLILSKTHYD